MSAADGTPSPTSDGRTLAAALRQHQTNQHTTLDELSHQAPTLVVFLRHAGCTFCREALHEIRLRRRVIESQGTRIVLVHQGSEDEAAEFFPRYGVGDLPRISNPDCGLYRAFGIGRGGLRQFLHWRVWIRGLRAALIARHGFGPITGDGRQMPGVFLLVQGKIVRSYRHDTPSDRPDYLALARCGECTAAPA